jgi:hypothetical protein
MAWISTLRHYRKQLLFLLPSLISFGFSFSQTIFQSTDVPANPLINDSQPIETGVKFRASQNGYITGIRYYKGANSTGTRIGQLWSNTGTLLASANFANETSSGWQQVLFNSPFAITANTTYIAACHSSSGDYAFTSSFFNQAVVNGSLRGLANGEDGPNGVFVFSQIPMFPTGSFQASNYWVDVVFSTTVGPDTYPPVIIAVSPSNGSANISVTATVTATFNEAIDPSTINNSTVELRNASNTLIPGSINYNTVNNTITLSPTSVLTNSTTYTAKIKGGATGVKDIAGNALANDYTWAFTTADPPIISPTEGYGGPVLVISSTTNPFSRYTVEILRAEGLNEFTAKDISSVTETDLLNYDVIIAGEMSVTAAQVTMFTNWVNAGGVLISFKPDALLAPLLGLSNANGALTDKYLLVNTSSGPGVGIVNQTIQFHGSANLHDLNGATSIATLYSDASTATNYPAVTTINVGSNGGRAIAFTYDLAKSVIYTRQGNPAWAGQKRDGQTGPIRSDDLFFPDWIDFNKIAIPQADEQQRLLANIILQSNLHRKPLPRFWYLPKQLKAAVVMTGDDHANNGTTGRFNQYLSFGSNTPQDVADWNAIRATSYIYPNTPITNAQAAAFQAQGFEIALHATTQCENYTAISLENNFTSQLAGFTSNFPGLSSPVTNRTHCMPWSDWSTHATAELNHGMRLDVNYYYWPASWVQNRPGMFTGSGMPMRFADINGALIDCYQATTQMTDESGIAVADFCNAVLDKATGPEGYYGVFTANMHTDSANHSGSNAIIASAQDHKIPVISAKQMLTWIDGRNNSFFGPITWNNNQLAFSITAPTGARNLNAMLPTHSETGSLVSITKNGSVIPFVIEMIKGIEYAFYNVSTGTNNYAANYSAAPVITIHPSSQAICIGDNVSFVSAAAGNPLPTVQWQESINGTNWMNINGANNGTLTFTPAQSDNNKQYRAVWTNSSGSVNSTIATLTVNPIPVMTSTSTPPAVTSGTLFHYSPTSNISGTFFSWKRIIVPGISNPTTNGVGDINETLINITNSPINVTYTYMLLANNCSSMQNVIVTVNPSLDGCSANTSITANFNNISIPAGRYIWFSSVFKAGNISSRIVNFTITNSRITYTVNNQLVTLNVPDAHIRFDRGINSANTSFINNVWETQVPGNTGANVFLTGLSYRVPSNLPGGIKNVKWSMNIAMDNDDVTVQWKWTAGVYANFTGNAGLNVKPVDGLLSILNPLLGVANAGTPLNYSLNIVPGAMGAGLLNITNTFSSSASVSCATNNSMLIARQTAVQSSPLITQSLSKENWNVRVDPNPSTDHFNITVNGSAAWPVSVRVVDISGRVVQKYEKVTGSAVLQVGSDWKNGIYFAEVVQGNERKIIKLIKAN